jgi:diguanylate cyclase (GGDEF)-like protein
MLSGEEARAMTDTPREAARLAFRIEVSDAISGIIDRDHFLQRLARRVSELTGLAGVAIYTRAMAGGDFMLRSSTVPPTERVPPRVTPGSLGSQTAPAADPAADLLPRDVIALPIAGAGEPMGALVLYSAAGMRFGDQDQQMFAGIAEEIAPAIAVAEHHHAVKQASVIDLTTGAYAGWYLTQRFDAEIARAQRGGDPVTIVLASVLDFEEVQRALGYERADQLLRDLAAEFSGLTRVFDVVGVLSTSEFAILLPDTDLAAAATVIARVHQRSARVAERLRDEGSEISVQVVTGAASFPADGDRVPNVMLVAEHRLNQNEVLQRRMAETP